MNRGFSIQAKEGNNDDRNADHSALFIYIFLLHTVTKQFIESTLAYTHVNYHFFLPVQKNSTDEKTISTSKAKAITQFHKQEIRHCR